MKKCPFCAEEIQEDSGFCKHCKKEVPKPSGQSNPIPSKEKKSSPIVKYGGGCLSLWALLALITFVASTLQNPDRSSQPEKKEKPFVGAGDRAFMVSTGICASSEAEFNDWVKSAGIKDQAAIAAMGISGRLKIISNQTEVVVRDISVLSGWAEVTVQSGRFVGTRCWVVRDQLGKR